MSIRSLWPTSRKYFAVGLAGLATDLSGFAALVAFSFSIQPANAISIASAATMTFFLHLKFTYGVRFSAIKFISYAATVIVGLVLATFALKLLIASGATVLSAKFIASLVSILVQFLLNTFGVFRAHTRSNQVSGG